MRKYSFSGYLIIFLIILLIVLLIFLYFYFHYDVKVGPDGLKYDAKDDMAEYKAIIENAGKEAEEELKKQGIEKNLGYCHTYWETKKRILKEKHHLKWKTPAELNPFIRFD